MNSPELYATADFCLIPMGLSDSSVAIYIAECQRVLKKTSLKYKANAVRAFSASYRGLCLPSASGYGTNIEGPWSAVSDAIHACHAAVHAKGAPRIATDIRIGTRVDREIREGQCNEDKVKRVEDILRLQE